MASRPTVITWLMEVLMLLGMVIRSLIAPRGSKKSQQISSASASKYQLLQTSTFYWKLIILVVEINFSPRLYNINCMILMQSRKQALRNRSCVLRIFVYC